MNKNQQMIVDILTKERTGQEQLLYFIYTFRGNEPVGGSPQIESKEVTERKAQEWNDEEFEGHTYKVVAMTQEERDAETDAINAAHIAATHARYAKGETPENMGEYIGGQF